MEGGRTFFQIPKMLYNWQSQNMEHYQVPTITNLSAINLVIARQSFHWLCNNGKDN